MRTKTRTVLSAVAITAAAGLSSVVPSPVHAETPAGEVAAGWIQLADSHMCLGLIPTAPSRIPRGMHEEVFSDVLGQDASLSAAGRMLVIHGYGTDGKWAFTRREVGGIRRETKQRWGKPG